MSALSRSARETIRWWDLAGRDRLTIAGYVRRYYPDGAWGGDACGCVDDRCIGFHHEAGDECHCLEAWLDEAVAARRAAGLVSP